MGLLVAMSSSIKSYLECKKRDLSNKSTNEEERKKAKESSFDLSLSKDTVMRWKSDDTNVFAKEIESPRCASILYDCLKDLQQLTKYLRLTLVFMWNSAQRGKFSFYFSRGFL